MGEQGTCPREAWESPSGGWGGCSFWSQGLTEDRNKARVRGQSGANVSLGIGLRMELGVRLGWGQPKDRN